MLHYAAAQGVSTGFQLRFGRLDDVSLSKQSIQTGETITITGKIVYMQQHHTQGWLTIHSDPGPYGRWTTISMQPSEHLIDIPGNSVIPFSITARALQPGTYHLSPEIYLVGIGPAMSSLDGNNRTEPTVVVTGNPICKEGFVAISKIEDGALVCVKPQTAYNLVQRGLWTSHLGDIHESILCLAHVVLNNVICPGERILHSCPIILFNTNSTVIARSGFVGVYPYTFYADNYVIEPGHNGTITYTLTANHPGYSGPPLPQKIPHELNITNYATFFHQKYIPLVDIQKYPEIHKESGGGGPFYSTCYELPDSKVESCSGSQTTGNLVSLSFYDHPGVNVSFDKKSETIGSNGSAAITMTIAVSPDAQRGTYWMTISPGICLGGEIILLTVGDHLYS